MNNKYNLDHLSDDEITELFRKSVAESIEEAKTAGKPYCGYDRDRKQSYIQYPDGSREYES